MTNAGLLRLLIFCQLYCLISCQSNSQSRTAIKQFAQNVASLEMLCHSVNDRLEYGEPEIGELIGSGSQGKVYKCLNIQTPEGKPCAAKVMSMSDDSLMTDLTLELHTTRYWHFCAVLSRDTIYNIMKRPLCKRAHLSVMVSCYNVL